MKKITQITRQVQNAIFNTGTQALSLRFMYNVRVGLWHVDIYDADGNNIAEHRPLRSRSVLCVLPEGGLFVDGADAAEYDSLEAQRTRIIMVSRAEIEAVSASEPAAEVVE